MIKTIKIVLTRVKDLTHYLYSPLCYTLTQSHDEARCQTQSHLWLRVKTKGEDEAEDQAETETDAEDETATEVEGGD